MNVLFLIPTFRSKARYHPGIASLLAVLKSEGHKTDLLSVNSLNFSYIEEYIEKYVPHVIAVSTNSHQYYYVRKIIPFIRENFRTVKILIGGVHPTLDDSIINEVKETDAVCRGEGEVLLLQYINGLREKRINYDIPNIIFRIDGEIKQNKISFYVKDLNSLPYPDYSIFPLFKKSKRLSFPMRFLFNRGCPFNCIYCCNHRLESLFPERKNFLRYKSPQRVIEELLYFSDVYAFDHYVIDDDVFTLNKKWLLEFCNLYPDKLKRKKFEVNVRVGTADKEMFKALKDIGCNLIKIGLESDSESLRRQILGRDISQEDIIETANIVKSVGLGLHTFNMIGTPNETRQDVWRTIRLNRIVKPDKTQLTVFYPYKSTVLGDYCFRKGLVRKECADTYFTESILKSNFLFLTRLEVDHYVNFFKFYVYVTKNYHKARTAFIKGVRGYLSKPKYTFRKLLRRIN